MCFRALLAASKSFSVAALPKTVCLEFLSIKCFTEVLFLKYFKSSVAACSGLFADCFTFSRPGFDKLRRDNSFSVSAGGWANPVLKKKQKKKAIRKVIFRDWILAFRSKLVFILVGWVSFFCAMFLAWRIINFQSLQALVINFI